jgi:hypothetical protein
MRKVMMVVAVLITSCHVSMLGNNQKDGAHSTTSRTHPTKKGARLTKPADASAKRSKSFTFCSVISSPCTLSSFYLSSMLATIAVARFRGSRLPCEADRGALAPAA